MNKNMCNNKDLKKESYNLISVLNAKGIFLSVQDGHLKISAPKGVMNKDLLSEIKRLKENLVEILDNNNQIDEYESIKLAPQRKHYALSSAQRRLYLLQQMNAESTAYNMQYLISLRKDVEKEKLEEVFQQLIKRHESFRTSFDMVGEEPVQRIHEHVGFKLEKVIVSKEEILEKQQQFTQAFDLRQAPLLRAVKLEVKDGDDLLMVDMHHIISDGISQAILESDFQRLYSGEVLAPLRIQYKDYSEWQNSEEQQARVKEQENYWINKFEGEIPVLNLPLDYVRPAIQSNEGATISFALSKEESQYIKTLAKESDLTLYMTILSVFNILLWKLSGQEDIIVGTPIAGRNHTDLENIVGVFINTLAIRNQVLGNDTLNEFTNKLKQTTLGAFENQDYQFEELVENISVERDTSRNPIFDVMFNLLNHTDTSGDLTGLDTNHNTHTPGISKFDLVLTAVDYGEQLLFNFTYCTKLFKPESIERFIGYFKQIVNQIAQKTVGKLSEIEILSAEEKQQLLQEFNNTSADYPREKTIHWIFEERARQSPDSIALVYKEQQVSYGELNHRSNQIARGLLSRGLKPEGIVGVMVERSLEMITGVLGVLKAGGTYLPLDIESPKSRINYIIGESKPGIILSQESSFNEIVFKGGVINLFEPFLYLNKSGENISQGKANDAAYVIYTSGSTGKPKGVVVEHRNVVNLVAGLNRSIYEAYQGTLHVSLVSPLYFDASVKQIFPALTLGHRLDIIPESTRFEGSALVKHYTRHGIEVADGTPFLAQMLVQNIEGKTRGVNIRQFVIGGDELKTGLIKDLFRKINVKGLKVSNVYGPTECTDVTTIKTSTIGGLNEEVNASIGKPISNYEIYILGKDLELLPVGVPGELCISGEGVSRGYLYNEALTEEKFIEHPYKKGERLYRTGDLARWLPSGEIEFLGRIDFQVKIRGFRIELGEIESVLQMHKNVKECVVLAREENGEKYLCAYLVTEEDFNQEEIRLHLLDRLPDYMVPSYFVSLDKIPLTSNGKVNCRSLPSPEIKAGGDYVAPSNETEEKLVGIWSEVLNIAKEEISTTANFFNIGGHSLKASVLTGKIHKATGVEFPLRDMFVHSTIQAQAYQIKSSAKKDFESIPKAKEQEYYPLSSAQKRLYILQQMDLGSTTYNMPYTIPLGAESDKEKIEEVFIQLVKRHESFRTSFTVEGEKPVQRIHEQVDFKLEEITITSDEVQKYRQQFIHAFDLIKAPLLRATKVNIIGGDSLLMIDMHHIISDGISHKILEQDFQKLYSGEKLPPLSLQYKDYSQWQQREAQQLKVKEQEQYWVNKFKGEIPVLNLPLDYVRPAVQSTEGATVSFVLSKEETQNISTLAKENGITLFMSVLSVFNILLSKLSGQEDIIVGIPIAGRNHNDLENIVGMFVNTLAIRNDVNGNKTLKECAKKLKQTFLEAFENQDYQFEELVEKVSIERDTSRNPLFDVMFNMLNQKEYSGDLSGLESYTNEHIPGISKFDLTLTAVDYDEQMVLSFEYCRKLFKAVTIKRYISYFRRIVNQLTNQPEINISGIELISAEEKQQILYDFNNTKIDYPKEKTINELFEEQVEKSPYSIALVYGTESITYSELNKRSNQLSRYLILNGVLGHEIVGLLHEYSIYLYIGILGILKTGKAYLPIDTTLPASRIQHMIKDSEIKILLGTSTGEQYYNDENKTIKPINISEIPGDNSDDLKLEISSTLPAYVIYTSGSTGKPKGVVVENKSLVNLCVNHNKFYGIKPSDHISKYAGFGFDASVWEIFPCLIAGASLYIIEENIKLDSGEVNKYFEKKNITVSFLPTQFCEKFMDQDNKSLRILLTGGDKLNSFKQRGYKLYNNYGPTENTVVTTRFEVQGIEYNIPIGKPIENSSVLMLDTHDHVQPIGVPGELCISGDGLAREYLNNPELTREKFIDNPFNLGDRLYRTGDLARWLPCGNIEFLGRIDNQVKIRGFRIELGEIENTLQKQGNIKESVVLACEENGEKYLCAYLVTEERINQEELRMCLSAYLPDYMVPSYFVELDSLPLTSNGKVNRKALPNPEVIAGGDYVAPSSATEEKLVGIWSEVLSIAKEEISTNANFFTMGGHSLKASVLTGKIHKETGVEFPLRDVFIHSTIKSQANQIEKSTRKVFVSIPRAKEQEYYPLSSAQKRLYLLQQIDLESTAYNMPYTILLGAGIEKNKIEEVFRKLIKRHEIFRTSFEIINEELIQRIHEEVGFKLEEFEVSKDRVQEKQQQFTQAFDLRKAPLLRVAKLEVKGGNDLLMVDMHHIISDGISQVILERDFQRLYSGEELAPLSLQYKDYSQWQNSEVQQQKVKGQENYWVNKFEGEIPVLNLPTDYVRPVIQSHEGATVSFALGKEETRNIKSLAEENRLTLYMSVLSVFNMLLSRLSGQEDIVVGTPIAGRNHPDLENIVGVFVNTLAMRNEVKGTDTLKEFTGKLKQATLEAFENQDYQFEELVEKVSVERDTSRNPIFNVMFNLLNHTDASGDLTGLDNKQYTHTTGISKFDLGLTTVDYGDQILLNFAYCTKLFKLSSIERFIGYFRQIINQLPGSLNDKLSSFEILSEVEKQQLLYDFNNTRADYPKEKTIHQLFEERAGQTPERIALVYKEQQISYRELNQRSSLLAQLLIFKGLNTGDIVGILMDRSIEMIIGILGILKAQCTYLPLDIELPKDRLKYIIQESRLRIILSQVSDYREEEYNGELLNIFDPSIYINNQGQNINQGKSSDAAYIIYTSGSTGKPKGVIVEHGNVVNLINGLAKSIYSDYHGTLHVSLISPIYFDASVKQIFPTLTLGHSLDIIPESTRFKGSALVKHYARHDIQLADGTPFHAQMLVRHLDGITKGLNIRQFVIGGDEFKLELIKSLFQKIEVEGLRISNVYGPTECTDVTTISTNTKESLNQNGKISIGKPISNYEIFILGKNLELLPVGVPGELCISGEGVSRGYLFNDELTSEKFIVNPFKVGKRLYKTGDLARWLPGGEIEFLGRIDHQVKIRGFRIELGEIENVLQKHESVKECIVLAREDNGEKYLCAYIVTEEGFTEEGIRSYLSASLPDYMLPSYFVQQEKLPLTSNGKVNRKALPSPEVKAGVDYIAPSNAIEEKLVEIWSEVLNIAKEEISVTANFFTIGGHSLKAFILASRIHALYDFDITIKEIFSYSTIKGIASLIEASELNRLEEEIEDIDCDSVKV